MTNENEYAEWLGWYDKEGRVHFEPAPRLYPTVKEAREMRELIEKYGFKNGSTE